MGMTRMVTERVTRPILLDATICICHNGKRSGLFWSRSEKGQRVLPIRVGGYDEKPSPRITQLYTKTKGYSHI